MDEACNNGHNHIFSSHNVNMSLTYHTFFLPKELCFFFLYPLLLFSLLLQEVVELLDEDDKVYEMGESLFLAFSLSPWEDFIVSSILEENL